MSPPTKRGPLQNAGGTAPTGCDGTFAQLVNDGLVVPFGLEPGSGNSAWYQWWYRDPANGAESQGIALSNALRLDL